MHPVELLDRLPRQGELIGFDNRWRSQGWVEASARDDQAPLVKGTCNFDPTAVRQTLEALEKKAVEKVNAVEPVMWRVTL
jgi:hypothetical protein